MSGGDRPAPPVSGGGTPGPSEAAFALALASLPGMGSGTLRSLLRREPASSAWSKVRAGTIEPLHPARGERDVVRRAAAAWRVAARAVDPREVAARCSSLGITVHVIGDASYPADLLRAPGPPPLLFSAGRGRAALANGARRVAVVGTRSCTHYGEDVAAELGAGLAANGVTVVSCLSGGIDAAAHEGALVHASLAPPLAVLGCGLDVVYPASSRRLRTRVLEAGALLAEARPGAAPEPWRFPARGRLIAGLVDVVVVVEAHRSGGTTHVVDAALGCGVPVAAVPGSVRSPASAGTNALLSEGAAVARDVDDVLALLSLRRAGDPCGPVAAAPCGATLGSVTGTPGALPAADDTSNEVLTAVRAGATCLEAVVAATGLPIGEASLALEHLAAGGLVSRRSGSYSCAATHRGGLC